LTLLSDGFYHLALELIDEYTVNMSDGNWKELKETISYTPGESLALSGV
jgi:hypothetical protein